jgi:hypothetical protein
VDRAKVGFLSTLSVLGLAYGAMVWIAVPASWRGPCILAPFAVIVVLVWSRIMRGHYEYKAAQLKSQPTAPTQYVLPGKRGRGEDQPVVRPVFISSRQGERNLFR